MIVGQRILGQLDFPSETVRLYEGSGGPYVDDDGNIWRACLIDESALEQLELAINAEATSIPLTVGGIDEHISGIIWNDYLAGNIVGARVRFMLQDLDEFEQAIGAPDVLFTGTIDNVTFSDAVNGDRTISAITVTIVNRFTLRTLTNGGVLSDVDQRARSKLLNPGGTPDRLCERIPGLSDKTIVWPRWN